MKTIHKLVLMLLIISIPTLSLLGCNGGTEDVYSEYIDLVEAPDNNLSSENSSESSNDSSDAIDQTMSSRPTVKKPTLGKNINITINGKTPYRIVASLSADGYDQARLIQKVIKKTCNTKVPLILDFEDKDGTEIIIGDTKREASKQAMKELGKNEYIIKVDKNGDIVIVGDNLLALEYAVKEFLSTYFGYDSAAKEIGEEKAIPTNLNIHKDILLGYKLVWNEDFNGSTLDRSKWNLYPHMSAQPNMKLSNDADSVFLKDGCVYLRAKRIEKGKYSIPNSLSTNTTMAFKYGYIEIRAKVPFDRPAFPSFWMQSSMYERKNPYIMSEIDIFECFGLPKTLESTLHKWYQDGTNDHFAIPDNQQKRWNFNSKSEAEQWHTYGLLWTPTSLNFMVDKQIYQTNSIAGDNDFGDRKDGMGCFHDYHHIIFNNYLYTEGASILNVPSKAANENDEFPIDFIIDYVRIYQVDGEGSLVDLTKKNN